MDIDDYIGRGPGARRARRPSKPAADQVNQVERIGMTTYKKDAAHVEETQGAKSVDDDDPEPHVSLSTIMAVFVSFCCAFAS